MLSLAILSFTTFFATLGPVDVAAMFAALTAQQTPRQRLRIASKGCLIAGLILLGFIWGGQALLAHFGISMAALRTAGGILLLLIAIELVSARTSGFISTTDAESLEARSKSDISVFPLATPLMAGPGAMSAAILMGVESAGDLSQRLLVSLSLLLVMLVTWLMLLGAAQLTRWLGVTGLNVITRVFGVLLAALAVQFVFDGIAQSGLL